MNDPAGKLNSDSVFSPRCLFIGIFWGGLKEIKRKQERTKNSSVQSNVTERTGTYTGICCSHCINKHWLSRTNKH